jgi:hypothetical protein
MPLYVRYADRATPSKKETSELGQIQIQDDVYKILLTPKIASILRDCVASWRSGGCPGSVPRDNLKVLFTILY